MSTVPGRPAVSEFAAIDLATARSRRAAPSFTATPISGTQVSLSWARVAGASRYLIEESVDGNSVQLATVSKKATAYTVGGLNPGTKYTFDIVYVKGRHEHSEASQAAATPGPSPGPSPTPAPGEILSANDGATDPLTQNFSTYNVGSGSVGPATGDQGHAAWEITDTGPSDQLEYMDQRPLTASQAAEVASQGFTETLVARVTRNGGLAPAWDQSSAFIGGVSTDVGGSGQPRFDIYLAINSSGDTVVVLPTSIRFGPDGSLEASGPSYTLKGSGSSYHTYQLYYSPATSSADLYIDGHLVLTGYTGNTSYTGSWRLYWGTTSGGQGFFSQVELQTGSDIVSPS